MPGKQGEHEGNRLISPSSLAQLLLLPLERRQAAAANADVPS